MTAAGTEQAVGRAPRPPLLLQGLASALLAAGLLGLTVAGDVPMLAGTAIVQLLGLLGFLAVSEAPAAGGVFLVALAAGAASDIVVVADHGRIEYVGGVLGLSLVAGLLHQLSRKERARVTESLADTLVASTLVCSAACLAAAPRLALGDWATRTALVAAGVALLAGRLLDRIVHRPALTLGSTRAWPGFALGLALGVAAAVVTANGHLSADRAGLLGLSAAATVATADLLVDLAAAELTAAPADARRVAALKPTALFLPFALLGPVLVAAIRLLEQH